MCAIGSINSLDWGSTKTSTKTSLHLLRWLQSVRDFTNPALLELGNSPSKRTQSQPSTPNSLTPPNVDCKSSPPQTALRFWTVEVTAMKVALSRTRDGNKNDGNKWWQATHGSEILHGKEKNRLFFWTHVHTLLAVVYHVVFQCLSYMLWKLGHCEPYAGTVT